MSPSPVPERGGGQWQVETAKTQVRHTQVDDEHGRSVAHLEHKWQKGLLDDN